MWQRCIALSDFMPKGMEEVSSDSVKQMLKKIIQNEDKKKPLSDQKLVKKLEEEGVQISRRTVVENTGCRWKFQMHPAEKQSELRIRAVG